MNQKRICENALQGKKLKTVVRGYSNTPLLERTIHEQLAREHKVQTGNWENGSKLFQLRPLRNAIFETPKAFVFLDTLHKKENVLLHLRSDVSPTKN